MKLDKSTYYPKSHLDDEEEIAQEVIDNEKISEPTRLESASSGPVMPEPEELPTPVEKVGDMGSTFLSWVLVPLFMPVYGVMLAFGLSILQYLPFGIRTAFTLIAVAFNVAIPMLVVLLLKKLGIVQDVGLNGRKERLIPYLVSIACLVATAIFFQMKGAPLWLTMFFYGGAAAGVVEVIVNFWWKISVHAAGIAGIVALLLRLMIEDNNDAGIFIWLIISIALSGLLGAARIWLGRHTPAQVMAGYLVGFSGVFFMTMIH